jgi:hypothetical protein
VSRSVGRSASQCNDYHSKLQAEATPEMSCMSSRPNTKLCGVCCQSLTVPYKLSLSHNNSAYLYWRWYVTLKINGIFLFLNIIFILRKTHLCIKTCFNSLNIKP